jgi:cellulose synthase/poly-beta-1,6-N-acetylglucosamine synthase-like glycosyltransferase
MTTTKSLAGFIPAYNAAETITGAVSSLRRQQPFHLDVLVIDDASTDTTAKLAEQSDARVFVMPANSGRGAVRAKGVELLDVDFIVSLDSGNEVKPDFVARAMPLFDDPSVAAVIGHWADPNPQNLAHRWRARHLFKIGRQPLHNQNCHLATHGCILRRSAILAAGNFNSSLRHTEDNVLSHIIKEQGFRIVSCPSAQVKPQKVDRLCELVQRYWRWHAGATEAWSLSTYFKMIKNAHLVMAPRDWQAKDIPSMIFTLILPHWLTLYSLNRKLRSKRRI